MFDESAKFSILSKKSLKVGEQEMVSHTGLLSATPLDSYENSFWNLVYFFISDLNECKHGTGAQSTDQCDVNAGCQDIEGSYKCLCLTGYAGDGFTCESKIFLLFCRQATSFFLLYSMLQS